MLRKTSIYLSIDSFSARLLKKGKMRVLLQKLTL